MAGTTTRANLEQRLTNLCTGVFFGILALLPVHAFISTWAGSVWGAPLVWKSWKEIALLALLPFVIWLLTLRPDIAKLLRQRRINQLIIVYAVLHAIIAALQPTGTSAEFAGLAMDLRFLAMFMLAQVIVAARPSIAATLTKQIPGRALALLAGLGLLALLQVTIVPADFLTHFGYGPDSIAPYVLVDNNPHLLRAFATLRGPNTLGAFLLLPLAIVGVIVALRRFKPIPVWVVAGCGLAGLLGLFLTGSRSAVIGFVVTAVALDALLLPHTIVVFWLKRLAIPALLAVAIFSWMAVTVPSVRLAVFHSSPDDASLIEGSSQIHGQAINQGLADVIDHPFGNGPGSAGPASFYNPAGVNLSENYYIQIAQEVGIIGLALFAAICVLIVRTLLARRHELMPAALLASFAGLSVIGLFLHVWADDPTAMMWWGLAGLFAFTTTKPNQ